MADRVAIVTGSNKGIGKAVVKGLCQKFKGIVYLTSRDIKRGEEAVKDLKALGLTPKFHQLDVADRESIEKFRDYIKETHGGIDILINNAAIANVEGIDEIEFETSKNIIDINFKSIYDIQDLLFPLLRNDARVLNISSDCGHLSNIRNEQWIERLSKKDLEISDINEFVDWFLNAVKNNTFNRNDLADNATIAAYRISKVALSALTIIQQKMLADKNIAVNSMHPGLVQTDMTLNVGFFSADDAAEIPIWIVLEAPEDVKGKYIWYDGRILDWYDANADWYFKSNTLFEY